MRTQLVLRKVEAKLAERLEELQECLQRGDSSAWQEFLQVTATLVSVHETLAQGPKGDLLTTGEMASRLGLSSKTLLRYKKDGRIAPSVAQGKHLRWTGEERLK